MARTRNISPAFFQHPDLYDAEAGTGLPLRLAFAGLWCHCDREGRFEWKPRVLKLGILPHDPVDFGAVLDALTSAQFVVRYEVAGYVYGWIPTFTRHQRPHPKEAPSKLPDPPPCNAAAGREKDIPSRSSSSGLSGLSGLSGPSGSSAAGGGAAAGKLQESERWQLLAARLVGVRENWHVERWLSELPATVRALDWVNTMLACLEGLGMPAGRPASVEALVATCRDWGAIEDRALKPKFFRKCVGSAMREVAGRSETTMGLSAADIVAQRARDAQGVA